MPAVWIKPGKQELRLPLILAAVLGVLSLAVPSLAFFSALLLPPLLCPLADKKEQKPYAFALCFFPALGTLLAGYHPVFCLSLLLIPALPLAVAVRKRKNRRINEEIIRYIAASTAGLLLSLAAATLMMDGVPADWLVNQVVSSVENSPYRADLLMRLALFGIISVPRSSPSLMMAVLIPSSVSEMLLSLRSSVKALLFLYVPGLAVHTVVLSGIFTALRVAHFRGCLLITDPEKRTMPIVVVPPVFRQLSFPRPILAGAAILGLLSLVLQGTVPGSVFSAAFSCCFALQGAAVLISRMAPLPDDTPVFGGLLSAALYVMFPTALILLGAADCIFHFRKNQKTSDHDQGGKNHESHSAH